MNASTTDTRIVTLPTGRGGITDLLQYGVTDRQPQRVAALGDD